MKPQKKFKASEEEEEEEEKVKAAEEKEEEDSDLLTLSLASPSSSSHPPPKPSSSPSPSLSLSLQSTWVPSSPSSNPNLQQHSNPITQNLPYPFPPFPPPSSTTNHIFFHNPPPLLMTPDPSRKPGLSLRSRSIPRNPRNAPREATKSETIPAPFPWAKNRRAMVHSLRYLRENRILTITGTVQCKTCDRRYLLGFDLEEKFAEVSSFIKRRNSNMFDRAPDNWKTPILQICKNCGNSVRPVVSEKKRSINWLFLFLGQMLGCCTLEQLKYYCKHNGSFRTGAKDRILYLTYMGLHEQLLEPTGL